MREFDTSDPVVSGKQKKINLALFYGGRSGEHEISLLSAAFILQSLSTEKYSVFPVCIDHSGLWKFLPEPEARTAAKKGSLIDGRIPCFLARENKKIKLIIENQNKVEINFVFPILHGSYGEDGKIQGYFEMMGIPYAGSGVCGSAVAMNKIISKQIIQSLGIEQTPFTVSSRFTFDKNQKEELDRIEKILNYPVFIKPANLGSSVGITRADTISELKSGINEAFKYDHDIIIEKGLTVRELEIGVIGNSYAIMTSEVGEVIVHDKYYSYNAKYHDPDAFSLKIPAQITGNLKEEVQSTAKKVYRALNCQGFARADLFYVAEERKLYFNEINTIPGFTQISMFPRLWQHSGISGTELVDKIISFGLERFKQNSNLKVKY